MRGIMLAVLAAAAFASVSAPAAADPAPTFPSLPGMPTGSGHPTFTVPPPTGGPAPSIPAPPVLPRSDTVTLTLAPDGGLAVREVVSVPRGTTMTRTVPLRAQGRTFAVRDARVDGDGTAKITPDALTIELDGGSATVDYTVLGAVVDVSGTPELRWQPVGGWDTELLLARISLTAPQRPVSISCTEGPAGSTTPCRSVRTDAKSVIRIAQLRVPVGDGIDVTAVLTAGSVKADAPSTPGPPAGDSDDGTGPFAVTWFSGAGLIALLALLLAGFALLWFLRGRDAKPRPREPLRLLHQDGEHVHFAPPGGLLPGRLGTVLDGYVDVKDVSGTIVDLAVRGYLLIVPGAAADGSPDWQLVRGQPADAGLAGYERLLLDTVLPPGIESVGLAGLRTNPAELTQVRDALYTDVVANGYFGTRPDDRRGRYALAGAVCAVLGVLLTLILAFTVGAALIGLAVVLAGLVVLVASRWMPARTGEGSALLGAADDLTNHLVTVLPEQLPPADREAVFARSLPYAVVLGQTDRWLHVFDQLAAEDRSWYVVGEVPFADDFPEFRAALDAALTGSGRLRTG